ncbi:uncharacterized protein LOC108914473 [Anoplophora glabripennis]|uniref:uncharacterized protein LOC108914473 n=1 Tax=Anoplophora glabripennis TaxID=217634 RepID=UPI0008748734|nr:uncharacterized protein LOC108914473 [Anoplophora glabripennis]
MACTDRAILGQLKDIICDLESSNGQAQPMVCPPQTQPFAACCMVYPPPILAPTSPEPVKPLQLPCPTPNNYEPEMSPEEAEETRYANFYNNYNIDYHTQSEDAPNGGSAYKEMRDNESRGVTTDGKNPLCPEKKKENNHRDKGCPTGFKPCTMKLCPPPGCHPCGVWCAEIQPCPPKPKKVSGPYEPKPCTRPCCKHWKPKDGECKYDGICKAHCFEPPPHRKKSVC